MPDLALTSADIDAAAARLQGRVRRTPMVELDELGVRVKCESFQGTGAFKLRGATNAVLGLRPRGVVTASSGNHGAALATAARAAGIPAVVVMPDGATSHKRRAVAALGAEVLSCAPDVASRDAAARAVAAERGLTLIPAYDHPLVIAGQGTCGIEIAEQAPDATAVILPLGGGGLLSGVATALRARRGAGLRIIGVEPADGDDFVRSRAAGRIVEVPPPQTICDGARTTRPGTLTLPIIEALVDDLITVSDDEVIAALRLLAAAGLVAEPTGALALAGALRLGLGAGTVVVLSGRNIDPAELGRLLAS